ncbi:MAG: hypothetical protein HZB16_03700 [Armatimonadetes bacterium]|nr:hypothetical protein [Armatimonadota bacterium]
MKRRTALRAALVASIGLLIGSGMLSGCGGSTAGGGDLPPALSRRALSGVVINASTGVPIVAASVTMGGQSTVSGPTGEFTLPGMERVDQVLNASADNYEAGTRLVLSTEDLVTVGLRPLGWTDITGPPNPPRSR